MPENKEIPEELRKAADSYVSNHPDTNVNSAYGTHFRAFTAGAMWADRGYSPEEVLALLHKLDEDGAGTKRYFGEDYINNWFKKQQQS